MATADVRRSRKRREWDEEEPRESRRRKKKSHAFRNGCLLMLVLLCLVAYFAPALVARSPLRDRLVQRALKLDGTVTIGSASLGWFSPVAASDIELRDARGETVLSMAQVRTAKSLVGLLLDFGNVGLVEIDKPLVHVVCHEKTTNLEEMLAELVKRESSLQPSVQIKVTDGRVDIEDVPAGRAFRIEKLNVDCTVANGHKPIVLAATGALPEGPHPGEFKLDLRTERSADGKNPLAGGKIHCQSTALPLELADPLLRRQVEGADVSGRLSARLVGAWGKLADKGEASVQGETLISDFVFAAEALGSDRVKLDRVEIPCRIIQNGETIEVDQLAVNCELGSVTLTGSARMDDLAAPEALLTLARENYNLTGEVDLVQVARVLPETLRIRQGTEITSGKVHLSMASRQHGGETVWSGQVDASHLGATADGKPLVWENPLAVNFAARQTKSGVMIERAECMSSFLKANASGSINDLTATANFDLAQLVKELQQIADLSDLQLAGQGEAKLVLKRTADSFAADGVFEARDFQFVPVAGGEAWKEPTLIARCEVAGRFEKDELHRIDKATFSVEAGNERLSAELREPIVEPAKTAWPIQCSWRGDLAPWKTRLESCAGLAGWELRGTGSAQATVNYKARALEVERATCDLSQLQVWGHGWFVNEPKATLTAAAKVDLDKRSAEISEARLNAGTTAAIVRKAVLQTSAGGWKLDGGKADVGADLVTLYRWRHDPREPAAWRVSGRLAAEAELKHDAETTTARVDGAIEQLVLTDAASPAGAASWQEPRVSLVTLANYRHATGLVQLENVQLTATAMRCEARGTLPTSDQGGDIDVKGTLQYDWQQLAPLWRPLVGDSVQVAGQQTRPFEIKGRLSGSPLASASWGKVTGQAGIGWSGMSVHGFGVGPGDISASLADGQIRTKPIEVQVSEGQFTFAPVVQLVPGPAELFIPRGPVLSNVHLTPEMCKRGLKFIAPIVAETTVAEGRFSVSMDGGRVPLAQPRDADVSGRMAIRAQVKPGPVAQEFMVVVNELMSVLKRGNFEKLNDQTGSLMSIDTNEAEFRMVQQRVYHRNLKFTIGTLPITTHGSVGLDESLAMVAEIPIQANFLGRDLSLGTLEGQTLKIPIGGTLKKPQLDRGALAQITGQLLQGVTRGVLLDGVNKQLERLLPLQQQLVPSP